MLWAKKYRYLLFQFAPNYDAAALVVLQLDYCKFYLQETDSRPKDKYYQQEMEWDLFC